MRINTARQQVTAFLEEFGEGTMLDMIDSTGVPKPNVSQALTAMHHGTKQIAQVIYIKRWVFDHEGTRRYPRPVWALGTKPDARKPKADPLRNSRLWKAKKRSRLRNNFVFNMASSPRI